MIGAEAAALVVLLVSNPTSDGGFSVSGIESREQCEALFQGMRDKTIIPDGYTHRCITYGEQK